MGRKPNALILQFFERGPKLRDNSNRYPHTCKSCGETFPKGRIDSLTNHLTKKCPAISEGDRVRACLTIHGFTKVAEQSSKSLLQATGGARPRGPYAAENGTAEAAAGGGDVVQQNWTALETLAEVSRQIDLSEKHDDRGAPNGAQQAGATGADPTPEQQLELRAQLNDGTGPQHSSTSPGIHATDVPKEDMSTELQIQALLQSATAGHPSVLSVAAAATARLNPSLLDPQLREEIGLTIPPNPADVHQLDESAAAVPPTAAAQPQPWGGLTQMDAVPSPVPAPSPDSMIVLHRGGFRLGSPNSGKARHSRARFDAHRRKEVQEVRKIGACIRCRILRKTCSKGHPCDACRKVLSPRIWKSGCVRTKFSEQLDLYSAGVQIVLAQHRINNLKSAVGFGNQGAVLQVSLFPDSNFHIHLEAFQSVPSKEPAGAETAPKDPAAAAAAPDSLAWTKQELMMIDFEKEDVPALVELYMRQVMHEFVEREKSHFARVTMEIAIRLGHETNDELLKKAIELWGLVEMLDRERQWNILVTYPRPGSTIGTSKATAVAAAIAAAAKGEEHDDRYPPPRWLKDTTDQDTFTSICLQLTAAAERKAAATSKALLTGMQRVLQDSKTKIDHSMFFTTLILLNCVEKTTWAFKAWEQDSLQPMWPLEKPPGNFTNQGYVLADLLKMLLGIRKALPRTFCSVPDGVLTTSEQDPILQEYFHNLDLSYAEVQAKQESPVFSPTDSRSLELLFCSTLLLPSATGE